eukprot:1101402-Pyramimonas_sp.AAC.1
MTTTRLALGMRIGTTEEDMDCGCTIDSIASGSDGLFTIAATSCSPRREKVRGRSSDTTFHSDIGCWMKVLCFINCRLFGESAVYCLLYTSPSPRDRSLS